VTGFLPTKGPGGERLPSGRIPEGYPPGAYPDALPLDSDDTINVREILALLRRNLWLLIACIVVFGVGAFYLASKQAPQYRATAIIRLKNEREALAGGIDGAMADQMLGRSIDPLLSQMEVMRSRTVAWAVIDSLGLQLVPASEGTRRSFLSSARVEEAAPLDTLHFRFGAAEYEVMSNAGVLKAEYGIPVTHAGVHFIVPTRPAAEQAEFAILPREIAADLFRGNLSAFRREFTDVVEVSYTARSPELAQKIVNVTIAVFQEVNAREAQEQSRRRREFLEDQLAKSDSSLAVAQAELSEFRRREEVLSSRDRFAAQQAGILDLEVRREELRADRSVYVALLNALGTNSDSTDQRGLRALISAPGLAQNTVVSQLYQQLVRYQMQRDSATTGRWSSAANSPDVERLNVLIDRTEESLVDAAQSHLAALDARIKAHDELLARSAADIRGLPDKEAEEMRLAQKLETIREMSIRLREQYQAATVAEAVEVGQVTTIDPAGLPQQPIGTGKLAKVLLGVILGLLAGVGIAFLREQLNNRIRGKQDIEGLLGLAALGVIPRIETNGTKPALPLRLPIRNGNGNGHVERPLAQLVTATAERSTGAEAYRTLRTNLLFSEATHEMRSLMISSALPSEGKTTTAANLAVAFAQQGKKIVLVDADLRKARVHKVFGAVREPGLVEVLIGQAELGEVIRPVDVPGLSIITAGTLPPNPSELLGSPRMPEIVRALQQEFDLVLIDAPPVLVAGDASIVATITDATLVVVRAGVTERAAAKAAVEQLQTVGTRIAGAVLNDPDAKIEASEGYHYYAYKYYGDD